MAAQYLSGSMQTAVNGARGEPEQLPTGWAGPSWERGAGLARAGAASGDRSGRPTDGVGGVVLGTRGGPGEGRGGVRRRVREAYRRGGRGRLGNEGRAW